MLNIAEDYDKKNNHLQVFYCDGKRSPADLTVFVLTHWTELVRSGHCSSTYLPDLTTKHMIVLKHNQNYVGVLMWMYLGASAFIEFTVTDPTYRGNGLYKILHKYFDNRMIAQSIKSAKSQLHVDNQSIIEAAKKDGYKIEYYRMIKDYK